MANSPLISTEQYAMGGWQTVRGYYQSLRALAFFDWGFTLYRQGTIDPCSTRVDFRMAYEF